MLSSYSRLQHCEDHNTITMNIQVETLLRKEQLMTKVKNVILLNVLISSQLFLFIAVLFVHGANIIRFLSDIETLIDKILLSGRDSVS